LSVMLLDIRRTISSFSLVTLCKFYYVKWPRGGVLLVLSL